MSGAGPKRRRMSRNVRSLFMGNGLYTLGQWFQFTIIARLAGAQGVGAYAYALALSAPVMMLANLQLKMLLATDTRGEYSFRDYRALRAVTTLPAIAVIGALAWVMDGGVEWPLLAAVCAMRAADALSEVYCGIWEKHERMNVVGWTLTLNSVGSVVFVAAAALLGGGVLGAALGAALGSFGALAFVHLRTFFNRDLQASLRRDGASIHWRRLGRLAIEAAPLGVIILLTSLQQNVPRYFVEHHDGTAALGLFAGAAQLVAGGGIVISALGSAASPRLAGYYHAGNDHAFRALTSKIVGLAALVGIAGVALSALVGRQVLSLVYRPEFAAADSELIVLSVAAPLGFSAMLLGYALTAARIIRVQPILLTVTLVVQIACCATLVPTLGAIGAAWAVAAASAVQMVASWLALRYAKNGRTSGADQPAKQGSVDAGA